MYLLGYDIGSSSVKASLLDVQTNKLVASATCPKKEMKIHSPRPGWAEQNPQDWWLSIVAATKEILYKAGIPGNSVQAIGIAYQMHGLVLVDQNLSVLRPSIIWCDSRAILVGDRAFADLGETYCMTQLLNSPGNFTAAKLAWVKRREPDIYRRIHKFMLPGDYVAMKLSGRVSTTISGLSEGVFYDFKNEGVSDELLDYFEFDPSLIPEIVPTFSDQASLSAKAASELGLSKGIKITYRAGDQPNNALSLNVLEPGEIAATAGTSGVVYGVSDSLNHDTHSRVNIFAHVNHSIDQRRLGILLCINGTGIMYSWAHKNLKVSSYEQMNQLAENIEIGSEGLQVFPFGNGAERVLGNLDPGATFLNLQLNRHEKGHLVRAIQEGIAFSFRYGLDIMSDMGVFPKKIRAGHANMFQSVVFRKAICNLSNSEIELFDTDGAQGAARGAGIGLGFYNFTEAFSGLQLLEKNIPDVSEREQYEEAYQKWKAKLQEIILR